MSDTIRTFNDLKVDCYFVDGDSRTFTIKKPKPSLAQSDIAALNTFMTANNILVGDKYGATFGRITEAKVVRGSRTTLDLNSQ